MFRKEMVVNVITEYVIIKEAGALDVSYFNGMINGLLVGLGAHEDVVALCALYNEVLRTLVKGRNVKCIQKNIHG